MTQTFWNKKFIFSLVCVMMLTFSTKSYAFFGLMGPVIEPLSTGTEIGKTVSVTATSLISLANKVQQVYGNKITGEILSKHIGNFEKFFQHTQIPGTKKVIKAKKLEEKLGVEELNEDEAAVKRAIYTLFFEYPTEDLVMQMNYRQKARDFYNDTVIDIYSGSREVNKYLTDNIARRLDDLRSKMSQGNVGDKDGAGQKSEDMNKTLFNNYVMAHKIADDILALVQEMIAMKVQLAAIRAIRDKTTPLLYRGTNMCPINKSGKKTKDAQGSTISMNNSGYGFYGESYHMAFAHVESPEDNIDYDSDDVLYKETRYIDRDTEGVINFSSAANPKIRHPLYNNRYKINELNKLEAIQDNIEKALEAHNLKNRVAQLKRQFDDYHVAVKNHEATKIFLESTDRCGINLLSYVFEKPENVWCGNKNCKSIIENSSARAGISRWAIDAYDAAHASQATPLPYSAIPTPTTKLTPLPVTRETKRLKIEDGDAEVTNLSKNLDLWGGDEYADEGRKVEMLPWQVGAIGMETLDTNPAVWGKIKDRFRVWNDARSFYTQFIVLKYENFYTKVRYDIANPAIRKLMPMWNAFFRSEAEKQVKMEAQYSRQQAQQSANSARAVARLEKERLKDKFDLSKALQEIDSQLSKTINAIDEELRKKLDAIEQEYNINGNAISGMPTIRTEIQNRGDWVNKTAISMFLKTAEAAKNGLYFRSNPLTIIFDRVLDNYEQMDKYLYNSIENSKMSLCPLGEKLYRGEIRASSVHESLINDLKSYSITIGATTFYPYGEYFASKDTTAENEDYFVGAQPKERDLKAPKEPIAMSYAPIREIFHYDDVDYENSGGRGLDRKKFLTHGGKIPGIWKVFFSKPNPFMEHKFDLKGILDGDYLQQDSYFTLEEKNGRLDVVLKAPKKKAERFLSYLRGGTMPCQLRKVNKKEVEGFPSILYFDRDRPTTILDITKSGKDAYQIGTIVGNNPCLGIATYVNGLQLGFYSQKWDGLIPFREGKIKSSFGHSELGVFMEADESNNIKFRSDYVKHVEWLKELASKDETAKDKYNRSDAEKISEETLKMMPYIHNQIGMIINAIKTERDNRKAREEREKEIKELQQELVTNFKRFGIDAPLDIDLSQEKDYQEIMKKLKSYKEDRIKNVEEGIANTDVTDNEPVKVRIDEYRKNLDALIQDNEELVGLSEGSKGGAELAEDIASEKADIEAQKKEIEEDMYAEKILLQELSAPYCINIQDGSYYQGCPIKPSLTIRDGLHK